MVLRALIETQSPGEHDAADCGLASEHWPCAIRPIHPHRGTAGAEGRLGFEAHLHMLRHAVTRWRIKGTTRALQAYLGHRNIQHTVRISGAARAWQPQGNGCFRKPTLRGHWERVAIDRSDCPMPTDRRDRYWEYFGRPSGEGARLKMTQSSRTRRSHRRVGYWESRRQSKYEPQAQALVAVEVGSISRTNGLFNFGHF
jgi:hypothetical protein